MANLTKGVALIHEKYIRDTQKIRKKIKIIKRQKKVEAENHKD